MFLPPPAFLISSLSSCSLPPPPPPREVSSPCLLLFLSSQKGNRKIGGDGERTVAIEESHHSKRYEHQVSITCFSEPPFCTQTHYVLSRPSKPLHKHTIVHTICPPSAHMQTHTSLSRSLQILLSQLSVGATTQ